MIKKLIKTFYHFTAIIALFAAVGNLTLSGSVSNILQQVTSLSYSIVYLLIAILFELFALNVSEEQ